MSPDATVVSPFVCYRDLRSLFFPSFSPVDRYHQLRLFRHFLPPFVLIFLPVHRAPSAQLSRRASSKMAFHLNNNNKCFIRMLVPRGQHPITHHLANADVAVQDSSMRDASRLSPHTTRATSRSTAVRMNDDDEHLHFHLHRNNTQAQTHAQTHNWEGRDAENEGPSGCASSLYRNMSGDFMIPMSLWTASSPSHSRMRFSVSHVRKLSRVQQAVVAMWRFKSDLFVSCNDSKTATLGFYLTVSRKLLSSPWRWMHFRIYTSSVPPISLQSPGIIRVFFVDVLLCGLDCS